jgi:hypothetical protein
MLKSLAIAVLLAACSSDAPPPPVDGSTGSDTNLPFGATCTTASDTSTECASGVCTDSFDQSAHPICSQKCTMLQTIDPSCPTGTSQKCNLKGYCKP